MANEFIGYTTGLTATRAERAKLVKVEYSKNAVGGVTLQVVSGYNLEKTAGKKAITAEEFSARPVDIYDSVIEARWALKLCGWGIDS